MPLSKLNFKTSSMDSESPDSRHSKKKHKSKRSRSRSQSRSARTDHDRSKKRCDPKAYVPALDSEELYDDEGQVPPPNAFKSDADWQQHIFDAMAEDEGGDFYASQFYGASTWGSGGGSSSGTPGARPRSRVDMMTDEEYRRYIVNGIYVRQHVSEIQQREAQKESRRKKETQRRAEEAKRVAEELERERQRAVRRRLKKEQELLLLRTTYTKRWDQLMASSKTNIGVKDVPWPLTGDAVTKEGVAEFILSGTTDSAAKRQAVRREQMRFHPDKFLQKLGERLEEGKEKKRIQERVNEVSGVLNELWKEVNA